MGEVKECKKHGHTNHYKTTDRGRVRWACGKCNYEALKRRRKKIKKKLVEMFGGKCIICGYDKCLRALNFHHRDPDTKSFSLNLKARIKWDDLVKEAKKCDLLCANCHMEVEEEKESSK